MVYLMAVLMVEMRVVLMVEKMVALKVALWVDCKIMLYFVLMIEGGLNRWTFRLISYNLVSNKIGIQIQCYYFNRYSKKFSNNFKK